GGDLVTLTATEFELLRYLMRNPRWVLFQRRWNSTHDQPNHPAQPGTRGTGSTRRMSAGLGGTVLVSGAGNAVPEMGFI
ncbi:hypothetical protein AB0I88_08815, partial [Actinoplanes sp. NPDC049802]